MFLQWKFLVCAGCGGQKRLGDIEDAEWAAEKYPALGPEASILAILAI